MSEAASPPSPGVLVRLVALGAIIGVPAALVAALFLAAVHEAEHWLWTDLPGHLGETAPPWYLVIGLPVIGAAVVIFARVVLPGNGGHAPLDGIRGGALPVAHAPGIALAAVGTLSFGGVLGPEAPLIALGSIVGVVIGNLARAGSRAEPVLATAGSFSAISAIFGGPIVAGVMMTEAGVGLGAALIPVLLPGFVAAAIGYVLFDGLGDWGGIASQALAVPGLPAYNGTHLVDLGIAVVVGVVTAVVIAAVRAGAYRLTSKASGTGTIARLLLLGALGVGLVAQAADWLGADSQDVLFSGQASVPHLLVEDSTSVLVVLLVAKALAYAISLGCGFRGGPVFPAIFLGTAIATFAVAWFDVSPTLAIAVGAAAGMAAGTRLLLTSVLFSALLVGVAGIDATPAAVLAAVAAWLTITALRPARAPAPTGR